MQIIDNTYFERELLLDVFSSDTLTSDVNNHIEMYEPEYLQKLLGASLYVMFTNAIENPTNEQFDQEQFDNDQFQTGEIEERFKWLLDGHNYIVNGCTIIWPGFRNSKKQSSVAQYVYYHYRRNKATITTSLGETQPSTENSTRADASMKMARAWNRMVEMNLALHKILYNALDANGAKLYPELMIQEVDCDMFHRINVFNI